MHYTPEMIAALPAGAHMSELDPSIEMDGVWPVVNYGGELMGTVTDCDGGDEWVLVDWDSETDSPVDGNTCAMIASEWARGMDNDGSEIES